MKTVALLIALVSSPAFAASSAINYEGKFVSQHEIMMVGYETAKECEADKGRWEEELGCMFKAEDTVTVSRGKEAMYLAVETWGHNAHSCTFEGTVTKLGRFSLKASAEGEEYNDQTGKMEPAVCEVTVKYDRNGNKVSVDNNGKCQTFCGMRAHLYVTDAVRQK